MAEVLRVDLALDARDHLDFEVVGLLDDSGGGDVRHRMELIIKF